MKLVKTSFFSAVVTLIRVLSGFVSSKAIAIFTGPGGVAAIGAFSNFISIIQTISSGAINTGVIKYTAEFDDNEAKLESLFSTSIKICLFCSSGVSILLLLFSEYFSKWIFSSLIYSNVIRTLGLTIFLYSLNSLLISILNGRKEIKIFTIVNAVGSIAGLSFTLILVYFFQVTGALYSLVLAQSVVFFITLGFVIKRSWFTWRHFTASFQTAIARQLGKYSIMAIITLFTVPISQILIRNIIVERLGIDAAGQWQGMMRVSDGYLLVITTSLSTYYLPKLASLNSVNELRNEIFIGYKIILPTVFIGCVIIYFARFFVIKVLYTESFTPMEILFAPQLAGDFFKMAAWVLAYLMIAKAMTRIYIITEVIFSAVYVLLSFILIKQIGLLGATLAFAINYFVYFGVMIFVFRRLIFSHEDID